MDNIRRLELLNHQLNDIDDELVRVLNERYSICSEINKTKSKMAENEIIERDLEKDFKRLNTLSIYDGMVEAAFDSILAYENKV